MATNQDFVEYVCEQIASSGAVRYRKMFGEYMVYVDDKPLLLICDNTVFVKMKPEVASLLDNGLTAFPYTGAKEHYILDIDNVELSLEVIRILLPITPLPKPRKKKVKS
jgi:TfoX/Sxy family transcriptional regulator of competence genes